MAADIGNRLARSIEAGASVRHCAVRAHALHATRWASATFCGARHALRLDAAPVPAFFDWLSALPDSDFAIPGHLVADIVAKEVRQRADTVEVDLEILTLEDR